MRHEKSCSGKSPGTATGITVLIKEREFRIAMIVKVAVPQRFQIKMTAGPRELLFSKPGDCHYIGGSEVLPAPLEAEEERELLSEFGAKGDAKAKKS